MKNYTQKTQCFFFGFSLWKRGFMKPFFRAKDTKLIFLNSLKKLEKFSIQTQDRFFIWGGKFTKEELQRQIAKVLEKQENFEKKIACESFKTQEIQRNLVFKGFNEQEIQKNLAFEGLNKQKSKTGKIVNQSFQKEKNSHTIQNTQEFNQFPQNNEAIYKSQLQQNSQNNTQKQLCKNSKEQMIQQNKFEPNLQESEQEKSFFKPQISFVEDGFIRSICLGSDLTRPFSLTIDSKALYIDPSQQSDLECILQESYFNQSLILRAKELITTLKTHKFSKYNGLKHENITFKAKKDQKIILIPAQVEDDASMLLGGFGLSTLEFIRNIRLENPHSYLVFKPHPDVLSGNRKGLKDEKLILEYCDEILKNVSIDSAINASDEIHTITSTAGFDALLRGKKVFTYGLPFYANWGLTTDKHHSLRRTRKLSLEELVAGTLILYPLYLNPKKKNLCEIELCLAIMLQMQEDYFSKFWVKFANDSRNFLLRKTRRAFEKILKI